ncbi:MAG: hypothetical protein OXG41_01290 [Acidimicrobiaceae bacterium]|nr:hypothetical protein [Acidimicrobiaceae bacterium]
MTTLIAVAVGIPCLGVLAFLGMRRIQSLPFARSLALARSGDMRGIALQTIIIMVVLLAIAGSVAAVLLTRAGEETENLEGGVSSTAYGITNEAGCGIGGFDWEDTHAAFTGSAVTGITADDAAGLVAAGRGTLGVNAGYCKP